MRKGIYSNGYMDNFEKFNERSLPEKKAFYSHLNMEDITNVDYMHAKSIFKDSETDILGKYYDFYTQTDTLLPVDVWKLSKYVPCNIWNWYCLISFCTMIISIASTLEKYLNKEIYLITDLITDTNMFLMAEKSDRGGICHTIYQYAKANSKYMKGYDENKE